MDAAIMASRQALGAAWQSVWLNAPEWFFSLPGGMCGPDALLGVWVPSLDSVERRYPLTIAAVFIGEMGPPGAGHYGAWLTAARQLALNAVVSADPPDCLASALSALPIDRDDTAHALRAGNGSLWWTKNEAGDPGAQHLLPSMPDHQLFLSMLSATTPAIH
jgi:type VI secretion system protein ImpM